MKYLDLGKGVWEWVRRDGGAEERKFTGTGLSPLSAPAKT